MSSAVLGLPADRARPLLVLLKANGIDLNAKMGFSEYAYEPIVHACRYGDSAMVSLLLELGVELAEVGRPGRRLDWYKQYLRDDAVDSQLTALLPAELHARTNLEVRQEKERLEAAQKAEEQRLLEDETYVLDETTKFEGVHPNPHETRRHTDRDCASVRACMSACVRACVRACARVCAGMRRDFQCFNWCLPGRCELYRLEKGEKGTDEYKDVGSGILHLHRNTETGRQRVGSHSRKTRAHAHVCACAYGCACGACVRPCACAVSRNCRWAGGTRRTTSACHTTDTWYTQRTPGMRPCGAQALIRRDDGQTLLNVRVGYGHTRDSFPKARP